MRIGLNFVPPHSSPEEWGDLLAARGCRASTFPADYTAADHVIDAYVKAAADRDIRIAEVGIWDSPFQENEAAAAAAADRSIHCLELAEYVHACCCVNFSGSAGSNPIIPDRRNYTKAMYERNVSFIQELLDTVRPEHTCFALEPMQWMVPDSPAQYAQLLSDVNREHFAVHMDPVNFVKDPYIYTHADEMLGETFRLLGSDIRSCHLKDCRMDPGITVVIREVPLGEGTFPKDLYLKLAEQQNPEMPMLLEHLPDLAAYDRALQLLKRLLSQQGIRA